MRLPAFAAALAPYAPQGWTRAGRTDRQTLNTGSKEVPWSEGRSHVWGERGRRTALVLGSRVEDREWIVLLVAGGPGPLCFWLILLILLLHQGDGGGAGKSKRGRSWRHSGWPSSQAPSSSRKNRICPSPWTAEEPGSWGQLGSSWDPV